MKIREIRGSVLLALTRPHGRPRNGPNFNTGLSDIHFSGDAVRGAVPEPASWALMILGFGSAGAMLRRRKLVLARIRA